ncbi:hypothetical protein [Actinobaculum sp. 352]|uniref:hypothetical protein n=1 Tax=Actinobaculum sp. 352 TaxID=2490946 RepID=UPI000F7D8ADB|nr:hypothetical protein [Actinobaculum sp. 352]RTE49073.1 hypothetical protein EKN07_08070 [Actinobaculum sp. 352]
MSTNAIYTTLELLAKFRFVPAAIIGREVFPHVSDTSRAPMTSRVLKRLREDGLIDRQMVLGRTWVHWLTEAGAHALDVEGGKGGVKLAEYEHDLVIVHLYLTLREHPLVERIITEREARSECPDAENNPWAIPITRQSGKAGYAWPDIITVGPNGRWGHEVEWTRKNKQRLRLLMLAYGHHADYTGGVYYTTPQTSTLINEAATTVNDRLWESGYGRQIITRNLTDTI